MNFELIKHIILFVLLLLGQALVCNHIHLFDCATPFLYVYFVLMFRINYPRWGILAWAFVMGLGVDVFSNTPGVAAPCLEIEKDQNLAYEYTGKGLWRVEVCLVHLLQCFPILYSLLYARSIQSVQLAVLVRLHLWLDIANRAAHSGN